MKWGRWKDVADDFIFGPAARAGRNGFVARLPSGISSREHLFDLLTHALRLPPYFGRNWDALEECLRDLSWIMARRVILVHGDLPGLESDDLRVYIDILSNSVRHWRRKQGHELLVVFPHRAKNDVVSLLGHVPGEARGN